MVLFSCRRAPLWLLRLSVLLQTFSHFQLFILPVTNGYLQSCADFLHLHNTFEAEGWLEQVLHRGLLLDCKSFMLLEWSTFKFLSHLTWLFCEISVPKGCVYVWDFNPNVVIQSYCFLCVQYYSPLLNVNYTHATVTHIRHHSIFEIWV